MDLGATPHDDGTTFVVWAPRCSAVAVVLEDDDGAGRVEPMRRLADGTWTIDVADAGHGHRYRYRLDGGPPLPDPASRHQPDGVHGPSAVVDPRRFRWSDLDWNGLALDDVVFYELHVATFTPDGTFDAAAEELPRLRDLGITMVELMPVNAFPGARNWGYDGVFPSATQQSYGGPERLAAFVDTAHALGMGVAVDVVYNHLGPEGNVLGAFGPYFTGTYATPWGDAVNFSEAGSDQVRRYFIESACGWIRDFHVDALRVDAVHAIVDPTASPFVGELVRAVHDTAASVGSTVIVVAESAANDPLVVRDAGHGGHGFDAQWNDDFHHALRVALTGDTVGYYADYAGGASALAEVYAHGFALCGGPSVFRGRRHGAPLDGRPGGAACPAVRPSQLVVFDQNHDQVGNRPGGERLDVLVDDARRRLATAAVLLSPFTPLLFMGEEYGDTAPFPYFVDHTAPDLLQAVREGRAREFGGHDWSVAVPDPAAAETMESARLDPRRRTSARAQALSTMVTELLELRRTHPAWRSPAWPDVDHDDGLVTLRYPPTGAGPDVPVTQVLLNFSGSFRRVDPAGRLVFASETAVENGEIAPWSVVVVEIADA
ncbi:MAG: malto-oligosyltrehalose trehalohydrolase [Acidimicrobiales bacterium]